MFLPQPSCEPACGYPVQTCCTPTQVPGPQGATGVGTNGVNGLSCFTFTIAEVLMPAIAGTANFPVASSAQFALGIYVWLEVAGEMRVLSKPDANTLVLQNTGWAGNAAATTPIPSGLQITPTGKSSGAP